MTTLRIVMAFILAVIMIITALIGFFWYVLKPDSVRAFCRKHPGFDLRGNMQNASNLKIRIMGMFLFVFSGFLAWGFILFLMDMLH